MGKLYAKLEVQKSEAKKLKSTTVYTDVSVIAVEKINALKGRYIDIEKQNKSLKAEMDSLRLIKDEQYKHLESITETKNYP